MQTIINTIPITRATTPKQLHMRPATLYYLRLEFNGIGNSTITGKGSSQLVAAAPLILYKLGYTTTSLHERVYGHKGTYKSKLVNGRRRTISIRPPHNGMGLPPNTQVYIISEYGHRNAALVLAWEQYLHSKYKDKRYNGPSVMDNGNTELYTCDILNLDY